MSARVRALTASPYSASLAIHLVDWWTGGLCHELTALTALTALSLVDNWNQIQTYPEQQLRNGDRIIAAAASDICHVLARDSHGGHDGMLVAAQQPSMF